MYHWLLTVGSYIWKRDSQGPKPNVILLAMHHGSQARPQGLSSYRPMKRHGAVRGETLGMRLCGSL